MFHLYFFMSMCFIDTDITKSYQRENGIDVTPAKEHHAELASIDNGLNQDVHYWDAINNL